MKIVLASFFLAGGLWAGGRRQITTIDPTPGWNRPDWTVGIPADWQAAGTVLTGTPCNPGMNTLVLRASSPDGLTGVKFFPRFDFMSSTNTSSIPKIDGCGVMKQIPALDFARSCAFKLQARRRLERTPIPDSMNSSSTSSRLTR
jgi:hypothetical protein